MGKKKQRIKGTRSSGAKKLAAAKRRYNRSSLHHGQGRNPNTGKTFLLVRPGTTMTLISTFTTRFSAANEQKRLKAEGQKALLFSEDRFKAKCKEMIPTFKRVQRKNKDGQPMTNKKGKPIMKKVRTGSNPWLQSSLGPNLLTYTK